jgi:hypothetical protein
MPPEQRPDVMALYPSWWGTFLVWFGRPVEEFNVRGNVICGGLSKVIYEPDFTPLIASGTPFSLKEGESLLEDVDVADLVSEKFHLAKVTRPREGYVDMKLLPDPREPKRDLFDAGRRLGYGLGYQFKLRLAESEATMLLRVAPSAPARLEIRVNDRPPTELPLTPADRWQEIRVRLSKVHRGSEVTITAKEGEFVLYHVFVLKGSEVK